MMLPFQGIFSPGGGRAAPRGNRVSFICSRSRPAAAPATFSPGRDERVPPRGKTRQNRFCGGLLPETASRGGTGAKRILQPRRGVLQGHPGPEPTRNQQGDTP